MWYYLWFYLCGSTCGTTYVVLLCGPTYIFRQELKRRNSVNMAYYPTGFLLTVSTNDANYIYRFLNGAVIA